MNKAKMYLRRIQLMDTKINQKQRELDELKQRSFSAGGIDYSAERVQTSPSPDGIANKVQKYVDLQREIEKNIDDFVAIKHNIISQIQQLENDKYVKILYKRYVEFKTLRMIANEMGYSTVWIKKTHILALEEFEKNM